MALPDVDSRRRAARALREHVPRSSHGLWQPPPGRRDPISILAEQERDRIPDLLPIRHHRMRASALAFLRGAAAVMAEDLATTPASGLHVQACGDAHLLNFGIYATPERRLLFDVNDFDETLPAPFEWDLKRLAASVVVAGRVQGFPPDSLEAAARSAASAYRTRMLELASLSHLEVWYTRLDVGELARLLDTVQQRRLAAGPLRRAQRSTGLGALGELTTTTDSQLRIVERPPLIEHLPAAAATIDVPAVIAHYRSSLPGERRVLLDRYRLLDWARKVVGVGSVGTDDAIALLAGDSPSHALFLQIKEAQSSVLEAFAGRSRFAHNEGERVVIGQRLMQSASDIFLGWTHLDGRHHYVRQLHDMKASVSIEKLDPDELAEYASACGMALAHGHARSGDPAAIAAYLGSGDVFDRAIAQFALAYADQTQRDYLTYVSTVGAASTNGANGTGAIAGEHSRAPESSGAT
jgi:uncharacterized protein (DUF2252 family)